MVNNNITSDNPNLLHYETHYAGLISSYRYSVRSPVTVYAQTTDSTSNEKPKIVQMPSFQGGDANTFARWISERIKYPETLISKGVNGRVVVKFVVERNGSLTFWEIIESPDTVLSCEVVLLALQEPRWKPAILDNGDALSSFLPISNSTDLQSLTSHVGSLARVLGMIAEIERAGKGKIKESSDLIHKRR